MSLALTNQQGFALQHRAGLIVSVVVHGLIIAALSSTVMRMPTEMPKQLAIQAVVIDESVLKNTAAAERRKADDAQRKRDEAAQQRRKEQDKQAQEKQAAEQRRQQQSKAVAERKRVEQQRKATEAKASAEKQRQKVEADKRKAETARKERNRNH